jgi:hypothetical protein
MLLPGGRGQHLAAVVCASWPQLTLVVAAVLFALEVPGDIEVTILKVVVVALAVFYAGKVMCRKARE